EARARADGVGSSRVAQATDVLAALIDHAVTSMPWGVEGGWQSVALTGGRADSRRPAQRMLDIARVSSSDPDLRELLAVAILLGFDKRSRGPGDQGIEQVLAQLAPYQKPRGEQPLSPDWRSAVGRRTALSNWLPFWVSICVFAALLSVLFFALELSLGV